MGVGAKCSKKWQLLLPFFEFKMGWLWLVGWMVGFSSLEQLVQPSRFQPNQTGC
jgi:hypothetical protein